MISIISVCISVKMDEGLKKPNMHKEHWHSKSSQSFRWRKYLIINMWDTFSYFSLNKNCQRTIYYA